MFRIFKQQKLILEELTKIKKELSDLKKNSFKESDFKKYINKAEYSFVTRKKNITDRIRIYYKNN